MASGTRGAKQYEEQMETLLTTLREQGQRLAQEQATRFGQQLEQLVQNQTTQFGRQLERS